MKTFDQIKDKMFKLYPGSSEDVFTIHHIDALIGQHGWLGIQNAAELGKFHLEFCTLSKYLMSKNCMSQAEQMWGFLQGLRPDLEDKVKRHLQIIELQHNLQDPYELNDLYEAACYCLLDSTPANTLSASWSTVYVEMPINIKGKLQQEVQSAVKSAMSEMMEMFKTIFVAQAQLAGGQANNAQTCVPTMAWPQNDQGSRCNFCSEARHFMWECKVAAEYVHISKCKSNMENKIVLPSGSAVPRSITGPGCAIASMNTIVKILTN